MSIMVAFVLFGAGFILFTLFGLWYIRREYRLYSNLSWVGEAWLWGMFVMHGLYSAYWIFGPEGLNPVMKPAVVGFPLMIIGGVLVIAAMLFPWKFSRWTGAADTGLETSGLYRFSRNPQYVGYFLLVLGTCLAWWNLTAWIGPVSLIMIIHPLILIEEEHLRSVYGSQFTAYCSRVERYIGWTHG